MRAPRWFAFFGFLVLAACDRSHAPQGAEPRFQAKDKPLSMETASVDRMEIVKRAQPSGEVWTATVSRIAGNPGQWRIESAPAGNLGDRLAAGKYLNHLLDTFQTFSVQEVVGKGDPERYGLAPPEAALRLAGHEVRLGQIPTHPGATGGRYASFPSDPTIYVVRGAALAMLDHLADFDHLRERVWLAPLESDEIDEIELFHEQGEERGKSVFYAQREGETWTDRKHHPWKGPRGEVSELLEALTHSRIRAFIDDEKANHEILKALEKKALYRVKLTRRGAQSAIQFQVGWHVIDGVESLYGTVDSRPGWAFQLYPELIRSLEKLERSNPKK